MFPMLGASLLSAAAGLPLHLMPLIVVAVVADGRLTAGQAGWVASAYMLGQMLAVLGLPALRFTVLRRRYAGVAGVVLLLAMASSGVLHSESMLAPWFVVGVACGALQFLGATTAAAAPDRRAAFALRLGVTLLVSGTAIVGVQLAGGFVGYATLALQLVVVFAVLVGLGLAWYRTPAPIVSVQVCPQQAAPQTGHWLGLFVIFLLFVGQPGFWAFAVQSVQQRGVVLEHAAYVIAFCKATAGCVLLLSVWRIPAGGAKTGLLGPGVVVVLGVLGMALARDAGDFLIGLLLWELGLNTLSVRLQAAVAQDNPAVVGPWLAGAAFMGAAVGPVLHGAAIQAGVPVVFVVYACVSAVLPFIWVYGRRGKRAL